ncbi:hypothetical protein GCM10022420_011230 [Streptomyces iranensis]
MFPDPPGPPGLFVDPPSPKKTASAFHTAGATGQNKIKLDDPEAAGKAHSGWPVAKVDQEFGSPNCATLALHGTVVSYDGG